MWAVCCGLCAVGFLLCTVDGKASSTTEVVFPLVLVVSVQVYLERRQREADASAPEHEQTASYNVVYEYRLPRHHQHHIPNSEADMKQAPGYPAPAAVYFVDQVWH